jgi:TolB-like protein/Flp pilus assembly protein TadD
MGRPPVWKGPATPGADDAELVRAALQRLLASSPFAHSHQLQRVLEFTVERTLSGHSDEIKEYTIAVEVIGRGASHDSKIDPIVRTEARRLRRKLDEYYRSEGAEESLRIDYPKGSYVPRFLRRADADPTATATRSRLPRRPVFAVVAALSLLVVGAFVWTNLTTPPQPTLEAVTNQTRRLAVLPFDDFSPGVRDPSLTYAITESLNTRLARIDGLSVASRTSVTWVKERNVDFHEMSSLLKADYLVEGSVIRSGNDCRITAQLVRARDDRPLWAGEYEMPWSDVLHVTRGVSESVAKALRVALGADAADAADAADEAAQGDNLEIAESYSRGQYYLLQFQLRRLRPHAGEAERYLKKTLVLDPDHVDAMVALAELSYAQLYPPQGDRQELLARIERYLKQALVKNPNHPGALSLLSEVAALRGDRDEALGMSRRALEIAPQDARVHVEMGARLAERGLYETALTQYEEALLLDPLQPTAHSAKLWILGKLGRFDEALDAQETVRMIEPEGPTVDILLGDVFFMKGNMGEARRIWTRGLEGALPGTDTSYLEIALGLVDGLEGHEREARRVAEKYRESPPRTMDHLIQLFAVVGETDLALEHIRHSAYYDNYRWLVTTPALRHLRADPRVRNLLDQDYRRWQRDLMGPKSETLSAPVLPPPEELIRTAWAG